MKKEDLVAAFAAYPTASHMVVKLQGRNIFTAMRSEKGEVLASTTADSLGGALRALMPPTFVPAEIPEATKP